MANLPKRVWSNKNLVYSNHKPVWKLGDKVGVYNPKFTEVDEGELFPVNKWENLDGDAEMQIYDSMKPTNIGTMNDGIVATYKFYDDDETTVLKTGTVKDGGTPVAPADPTKTGYTFTGWDPEVGPISEDTDYVATYEINEYTITIVSNDNTYGTVDVSEVTADYGTAISAEANVLTIGDTEITATAETGYEFSSWGTLPATLTENLTITAIFVATAPVE